MFTLVACHITSSIVLTHHVGHLCSLLLVACIVVAGGMASSRFLCLCAYKHNLVKSHSLISRTLSNKAYADSLNLPQTLFPLRANAAVRELEIQEVRNCSFA